MDAELGPLLKNLPPKTAGALVQAINICGDKIGMGPDWVRRWIAFTVIADALASYSRDGERVFELKGGAAIEMRMRTFSNSSTVEGAESEGVRPRVTKDLDATFRGSMAALEDAVREALANPRHNFTFRVVDETPNAPKMRRLAVHVAYQEGRFGKVLERPFSNVQLEVSAYEGVYREAEMVTAFSLKPFGIEGPDELPCMPLTKQVAQKLHAVTEEPGDGRSNDRFRDLVDLVMLSALTPPTVELREVCEETFTIRELQGWPPTVVAHAHWIEPMEQRAREMGIPNTTADAIVAHVSEYIRSICAAT